MKKCIQKPEKGKKGKTYNLLQGKRKVGKIEKLKPEITVLSEILGER